MPYGCVTVSMWGSEGGWGVSQSVSPDGDGECSDRGRCSQSFMAYLRGVAVTLYLSAWHEHLGELRTKFEPFDSHKHLVAQFETNSHVGPKENFNGGRRYFQIFCFLVQGGLDKVEFKVCWFVYVSRLGMNKAGKFSWRQSDTLNRNTLGSFTISALITKEQTAVQQKKFWTFTLFSCLPNV